MRAKSTLLVLLCAVMLLAFAATANAAVAWNATAANTQVVLGGKTEVLGDVTLTSGLGDTAMVASTITLTYTVPFTNGTDFGVDTDTDPGPGAETRVITLNNGIVVTIISQDALSTLTGADFTITGSGNQINVGVSAASSVRLYDQIIVSGVRADVSGLAKLQTVSATISSTPSNANTYNPSTVVVATVLDNFSVTSVTPGSTIICNPGTTTGHFTIKEGFNGAFVQYVATDAGTTGNERSPIFGATANTIFTIKVAGVPAGFTIDWPASVTDANGGGTLELIADSDSNTGARYEFAASATSDTLVESFKFDVDFVGDASKADMGTATFTVTMGPVAADKVIPYYAIQPTDAQTIFTSSKCVTNLLFPYVAKGYNGFDSGIAIANTSYDVDAITNKNNAKVQSGTITFFFYPTLASSGTSKVTNPLTFTSSNVVAGDSYANTVSAMLPNVTNFQGYVIAVANFQFAHGYAYISYNMGQTAGIAQGYLAVVLPDYNLLGDARQIDSKVAVETLGN